MHCVRRALGHYPEQLAIILHATRSSIQQADYVGCGQDRQATEGNPLKHEGREEENCAGTKRQARGC